ncbi:hypothetical protein AB0M50_51110, partial [Nonomuraea fuscirosea]|uniref:hypothetical protein n=1 Tax=Nonomuraea fuscirosea TaxID=1291556 RepID=UPI00343C7C33
MRILVGALAPLLLIGALYLLAHTTQNRYDQIKPAAPDPGKERRPDAEDGFPGLSDPAFWNGVQHTRVLTRLHVAGSLALVAALVAWTAHGVRPVAVHDHVPGLHRVHRLLRLLPGGQPRGD